MDLHKIELALAVYGGAVLLFQVAAGFAYLVDRNMTLTEPEEDKDPYHEIGALAPGEQER